MEITFKLCPFPVSGDTASQERGTMLNSVIFLF